MELLQQDGDGVTLQFSYATAASASSAKLPPAVPCVHPADTLGHPQVCGTGLGLAICSIW